MNDGSIRVGTKLDTSGIETDLKRMNQQLEKTSLNTQRAVNKVLNGKEMRGLDKQINNANNSLSKTKAKLQEIESELAKIQAQTDKDLANAFTDEQARYVLEMEAVQTKELRQQQELLNKEVKKYKGELESANASKRKLVDVAKTKLQMGIFKDGAKNINTFTDSVNRGIKKLLRMGIAVYGIRTAYTILSRAATTYINNNEGVKNSIQGVWNALGQLLGPVIEWVSGLLLKLIGYLDVFIQALTGVSIIAKANANALKKQTSAQEGLNKAQREQAGFDEQNVLSDNSSSSSSDTGGLSSFGGIDMSGVELDPDMVERVRKFGEICKDVFGWIKDNWKIIVIAIAGITAGIVAFNIAAAICNLLMLPISGTVLLIVGAIALLIAIIVAVILYWDELGVIAGKVVDWIKEKWKQFCDWFKEVWDDIKQWFADLWNGFKNLIKNFINWFKENWDTLILLLMNPVSGLFKFMYDNFDWFRGFVDGVTNKVKTFFSNMWTSIKDGFKLGVEYIKNIFGTVASWINDKVVQPIKGFFGGLWESLKGGPKSFANFVIDKIEWMINKIISGLNSMIKQLNKLSFDVPDWVPGLGGKKFGFNINQMSQVSLPRLAKGGIVNNPGKGVPLIAGEMGKEVVLPLENNTEWMEELADKIGGNITIPIYLPNGKKMAEYVIDVANKKSFAKGV